MKQMNYHRVLATVGLLVTAAAVTINSTGWALFINFLCYGLFVGTSIESQTKSIFSNILIALQNIIYSFMQFLADLASERVLRSRILHRIMRHYYLVIPALVVVIFFVIYRSSNHIFDGFIADFSFGFTEFFRKLLSGISWQWFMTFCFGLFFSIYGLVQAGYAGVLKRDQATAWGLTRRRNSDHDGGILDLKKELVSGVFLLVTLNLLILLINVIDVYWVWFNFEWEGEYLKQFVHEGTYLLILSILISIAIVLYYFRGNLNFYSRNIWLKRLCYIWLFQNAILAISVAVRNMHYIDHFALASKRIGVMFFLLLVVFGILSVFQKLRHKKSRHYLVHVNTLALIVVLIISALPNWNNIIVRYNFAHAEDAFLHLDYIATFNVESLPYLDKSLEELQRIEALQKEKFPFDETYMSAEEYYKRIQEKKILLHNQLGEATWQEWTWARQRAASFLLVEG